MQTISFRTTIGVPCSGLDNTDVRLQSVNGARFRAAIVPETLVQNDWQLVQSRLDEQGGGVTNFLTTVGMGDLGCGDRFVAIVEPVGGPVTVQMTTSATSRSDGFGLYQQNRVMNMASIKAWWAKQSGVVKGLIIVSAIILVMLIMWAIWKMVNKKRKPMSNGMELNYF